MTDPEARPFVTIAIPTYNRAGRFLPEALAAATSQTYSALEILVSDNASSDGTEQLVRSSSDPRIRYHRQAENIGPVANVDFCIAAARGDYFLLLMDDDLIDPDFVARCMEAVKAHPDAALVRTGTRVINGKGVVIYESHNLVGGLSFTDFVLGWLEGKTAPFLCSTLFKTEPLRQVGMQSRHYLWEDVIAELRLAAKFERVDLPDVLATFRMHEASMTAEAQLQKWCEDSQEVVDLVCSLAPSDAELLRSRLRPFMAMFNYRHAIRFKGTPAQRLAAFATVRRHFGAPHDPVELVREALRQTPLFETLRHGKRVLAGAKVAARRALGVR
jgi:glycosyltransferase involved in cell wall biosynthesis